VGGKDALFFSKGMESNGMGNFRVLFLGECWYFVVVFGLECAG
jgi:hypothetical protein